jgi:hypothetical protein
MVVWSGPVENCSFESMMDLDVVPFYQLVSHGVAES